MVAICAKAPPALPDGARWQPIPLATKSSRARWPLLVAGTERALRRWQPDLVHELALLPLARRVDLATVIFSWTGLYEALGPRAKGPRGLTRGAAAARSRLERWSYSRPRAQMLAALCPTHRQELERLFPGIPVELTPRGTDPSLFRPDPGDRRQVRTELGIGEDELVAAFIARDEPFKGLPLLIDALAEIRSRGRRVPLVVVISPETAWARRQAISRGVAGRLLRPGWPADVPRYLRAADLFVLPTGYETYSQAAHEAAATGLPVVGTRVSGIRELIGDDEAGVLVERSAGSVADAIVRLEDPSLRARLGAEGRRRCEAETIDGFVKSTLGLYERLLAAKEARSS
jgi:glycosyltransferase involved in cell wall biosynthesis